MRCCVRSALHSIVLPAFANPLAVLLMSVVVLAAASRGAQGPGDKDLQSLEPGRLVEHEIAGGQSHSYRIDLSAGQFIHVGVGQQGLDAAVALFDPRGKLLIEVNNAEAPFAEPLYWLAIETGSYRLQARAASKDAAAGRVSVKVEQLRQATAEDRDRVAAQNAISEGERLEELDNPKSRLAAIKEFEAALALNIALGDRGRQTSLLYRIGFNYNRLGEYRKALEAFSKSQLIKRELGDRKGESNDLVGIGQTYSSLGDTHKALDHYSQALSISREIGERKIEAISLSGAAAMLDALGESQKAIEYYNQALMINRALGDRRREATVLNNLAMAYYSLGEYQKALDHQYQALPIRRAEGDRRGEAGTLNNLGSIYLRLKEHDRSLDFYNESLPLIRAVGDQRTEGTTLNNIGTVYRSLGDDQKALDYFHQSLPIKRALGDGRGEAATLINIGLVHEGLGELDKALDSYNQSLELSRGLGNVSEQALALSRMGWTLHRLGQAEKADESYQQALRFFRAAGDKHNESITLWGIARLARERNNLQEATARMEEALAIIESIRARFDVQELRASYLAARQNDYEMHLDLLMQLHKTKPNMGYDARGLQAAEQARARSLLDTFNQARADIRQGVDPGLLDRAGNLRRRLNEKAALQTRLVASRNTKEQIEAVAKEIDRLIEEYQQLQAQLRRTSPRYAALTQPQPLGLKEIQAQVLDRETLLLEYALGKDRSYLFAVTPDSIASYELPGRAEIDKVARRFYNLLTARNKRITFETAEEKRIRVRRAEEELPRAADALSRIVLEPVAGLLGAKRLLIVGDGALQYIPFGALPSPSSRSSTSGPTGSLAISAPLITRHEIVSVPSASTLAASRRELAGRPPASRTIAVVADPVFSVDDVRFQTAGKKTAAANTVAAQTNNRGAGDGQLDDLTRAVKDLNFEGGFELPRLPFTRREAAAIALLAPAGQRKEALDFAASRAAATNTELSQYRVVHFATHGVLNSSRPELSGLVFSLVDEAGKGQDGFLRSHEIYNLNLPADLVVLSGCRTGLGKEIRGEGIVGLTRGFMYAGAARVMVSLWDINDEATAELMARFYRGLLGSKRLTPAAALQAAQVSMAKDKRWSAAYYWAPFILQGEPR